MRREALFAVSVAALLVLGGCVGGGGGPDDAGDGPSAGEIRSQSVSAMDGIDVATYEMTVDAEAGNGDVSMDVTGAVDRSARKQRLEMNVSTTAMGDSRTVEATAYVDGETMYLNLGGQWRTQNLSNRALWENGQIGSSRELMEAVSVSKAGTATVAGTETYVLELTADDTDAVQEALNSQLSQGAQGTGSLAAGDVERFDGRMYVATDSKHLRRMELNVTTTTRGRTVDTSVTITYTQVGGDVSIDLPEEATGRLAATADAPA
jgi:hypothetical protein